MNENIPATDTVMQEFGLSDDSIAEIGRHLAADDEQVIRDSLAKLTSYDTAELISKLDDESRLRLLQSYSDAIAPETFTNLEYGLRSETLSAMSAAQVAGILSELESDDALDLIINLDPAFQKEIIRNLSAKTRLSVEEGLTFPEDSAGRLMQREFVAVPEFWTVGKTIDYLRAASETLPADFFDVFVIDPTYRVRGEIPLNRLIRAKRSEKVADLTLDDIHTIPADMDQEEVGLIFRREDISSAPVIDEVGRLIGVITVDDVIDVINEEAQEDLLKLAGVAESDLYRAVFQSTRARFSWLFINLLTAILASYVISLFDATIAEMVALAVLMPIVASMGGNAGTQAMTVAVRALATKEISGANTWRIIGKETLVGTLNGIAFAVITGIVAALWFSNPMLGIIIGVAMIVNLIVAGFSGAGIPILLSRIGSDPAISSSVFLTTVTDVVGFFAFLGLAALIL